MSQTALWLVMNEADRNHWFRDTPAYPVCPEPLLFAVKTEKAWMNLDVRLKFHVDMALQVGIRARLIKLRYGRDERLKTQAEADQVFDNLQVVIGQVD